MIQRLLSSGNIEAIKSLPPNTSDDRMYLDIMMFKDQNNKTFFVAVYDSDELLQDPQVI